MSSPDPFLSVMAARLLARTDLLDHEVMAQFSKLHRKDMQTLALLLREAALSARAKAVA